MEKLLNFLIVLILINYLQLQAEDTNIKWMRNGHVKNVKILFMTSDGQYLATTGTDSTVKIFNTVNDSLIFVKMIKDSITLANISADKTSLVVGSFNTTTRIPKFTTYDIKQLSQVSSIEIASAVNFTDFGMTSDFKYISCISPTKKVYLWDGKTGEQVTIFDKDNIYKAFNIAFSPDNKNISIAYDSILKIYDYSTNNLVTEIELKSNPKTKISYCNESHQLMAYNIYGGISFFDANSGSLIREKSVGLNNTTQMLLTNDTNRVLAIVGNTTCYLIDLIGTDFKKKLGVTINSEVTYFNNGVQELIYTGGSSGETKIWDINKDTLIKNLTTNNSYIQYCNNGKNIFSQGTMLLDIENGSVNFSTKDFLFSLRDTNICFSTKGNQFLYLFNLDSNKYCDTIDFQYKLRGVSLSPDLKLCCYTTANNPGKIYAMDWITKEILYIDSISSEVMKYSKNNRYIAGLEFTSDNTRNLIIIDLIKQKRIFSHITYDIFSTTFCFSPDSKYVFLRLPGENTKMYNLDDMSLVREFQTGSEPIFILSLTVSPDGKYLVDGNKNGDIRIWEVETGNLVYTYSDYEVQAYSIDISPDSKYILTSYQDGTAILRYAKFGSTSVDEYRLSNLPEIKITPNPTKGKFSVDLANNELHSGAKFIVSDITGNTLFTLPIKETISTIDLTKHPNGIYFLTVLINEQSETFKIMKME